MDGPVEVNRAGIPTPSGLHCISVRRVVEWQYILHIVLKSGKGCTSNYEFVDDITRIGLISGADVCFSYRWEIHHLVTSCSQNNLELNTLKTAEMIVDLPTTLHEFPNNTVESFRFLGVVNSHDFRWEPRISFLPTAAEEVQSAKVSDGALLHCRHQVHPHLLHHLPVRCCHCRGQGHAAALSSALQRR